MLDGEPFIFRVTDLKQYVYCPRILYYHTVLPAIRPVTYKMEAGIAAHNEAEGREKRRSLATYAIVQGKRHFNVPLYNPSLRLSGELDLLIESEEALIPVDYKQAKQEGAHFRLQLMSYARLLEVTRPNGPPVTHGFLYLLPSRDAVRVCFTSHLRRKLDQALSEMVSIVDRQRVPAPTRKRRRCVDCEFRRFCNDIL